MIDSYCIVRGCVVLILRNGQEVVIPFPRWNHLIERIGHREPEADKECPP